MYSSTGCAVLHTLLIFIRVRGVGGVSWGGWKSGRVVWLQGGKYLNFPLLSAISAGSIQMALNGCPLTISVSAAPLLIKSSTLLPVQNPHGVSQIIDRVLIGMNYV